MTDEERKLWYDYLKTLELNVNRQKVIGCYVVDFYIPRKKIIIEIDGSQHFEDIGQQTDTQRDKYFASLGIKVLRYTNIDINLRFKAVCEDIENNIAQNT